MGAALTEALKITNGAALSDVLTAFVGSANKDEQAARITMFSNFTEQAIKKQGASIFGVPDVNKIKAEIINATIKLRRESMNPRSSSPFVLG